ncbi:MAG TPA: ABC transporter ATP-binding protein [Thermotogota bacterium]|nr:ABC transporter ATP-binding protein [Thermotogota bacterium]HRW35111.1 ABC transporter ATP-binding protein [Thermotogota bacterium]
MIRFNGVSKVFQNAKTPAKDSQRTLGGVFSKKATQQDGKKNTVTALDHVSFEVKKGRIFGLLGPNGAGKTTALRILSTLIRPTQGNVDVMGFDTVKDSQQIRQNLGFLSSDMNLSGNLSARDFLIFFGRLNHIEESQLQSRVAELSKYLEMDQFLDRRVSTYSTGMKQKTLIAIALIHEPDIVIFDEPTNGLDIMTSRIVLNYLKDLKARGKTIILSTHIMTVAQKMCDDMVIINKGKIIAEGTVKEILEKTQKEDLEDAFFELMGVDAV